MNNKEGESNTRNEEVLFTWSGAKIAQCLFMNEIASS